MIIGIVLEYIPVGEIYNYVDKKHHLDDIEACRIFKQLIQEDMILVIMYIFLYFIIGKSIIRHNITDFGFVRKFGNSDLMESPCGAYPFNTNEKIDGIDGIDGLYRHIIATTLIFSEYISSEAEDLLNVMLVVPVINNNCVNGICKSFEVLPSIPIKKRPTIKTTIGLLCLLESASGKMLELQ
ncbi:hypothetical protein Glove_349g132 [Diversispora epigaea]|uniref:Protein kinase domain-containing protein n=1 Tax=Diversispora epigaea TaxID=1348612 RepID=A0A397HDU4_9GLOM|nr:hypothetical protein Glove_349g132 [Diversispora epigaea]